MKKAKIVTINFFLLYAAFVSTTKSQDLNKLPNAYSTYLGGTKAERVNAIKFDKNGFIYLAGFTNSPDFPVTPGAYCTQYKGELDGYVVKIDLKANRIVWATYIGGSNVDYLSDMSLDNEGNIYVVGNTLSSDFPVTIGAFDTSFKGTSGGSSGYHGDLYVSKLSNDGSKLIYSTFLGGSESESMENLTVDNEGCVYVCASTGSTDYPVTVDSYDTSFNGYNSGRYLSDVVVSKLTKDGNALEYSYFLGGKGNEIGKIGIDSKGNIVIVGTTSSKDFPVTNGSQFPTSDTTFSQSGGALYVAVIDPTGKNLLYSSFINGSKANWPNGMLLDENDNLYITGFTGSSDFPVTKNAYQTVKKNNDDAFLLKFNMEQKKIVSCTYIGGGMADAGKCILKNTDGNIILTGTTLSPDFPITLNAFDTSYNGCNEQWGGDLFISIFDSTLSRLLYSTYLGGSGNDYDASSIIDKNNNLFIGGSTKSSDFPVSANAMNTRYNGGDSHGGDAVLIKLPLKELMKHSPTRRNDKKR